MKIILGIFLQCISLLFRLINETSCEARGCCYQSLNLQEPGAPVCHRKIPTLHGMRVLDPSNLTSTPLQFSHPENLRQWPTTTDEEKNSTEDSTKDTFQYRLRRLGSQHFVVHFFKEVPFFKEFQASSIWQSTTTRISVQHTTHKSQQNAL